MIDTDKKKHDITGKKKECNEIDQNSNSSGHKNQNRDCARKNKQCHHYNTKKMRYPKKMSYEKQI